MASVDTVCLCSQIIDTHFGPAASKITSILLTRGRLPFPHLVRFSSLRPRTVRAVILVLVQHNILWHHDSDTEGEILEFNQDECLARLRFGRYEAFVEDRLGQPAALIVRTVLDHGKLRPPDVMTRLEVSDSKARAAYEQALHALVKDKYLKTSTIATATAPHDRRLDYELEQRLAAKNVGTAKELREERRKANARVNQEELDAENMGLRSKAQLERPRSGKRKALEDAENEVNPEIYFRINHSKFSVLIRNQLIVTATGERYNSAAASVMEGLLKASEKQQISLSDLRTNPVLVRNICDAIADPRSLASGLVFASKDTPSTPAIVQEYLGLMSAADNPTPGGLAGSFVSTLGGGNGKVQVEFEVVCRRLQLRTLESVIREKFSEGGLRLFRFLLATGKMDEKHLAKVSMISPQNIRLLLSNMSAAGLISLQDVPKGSDRNPTRTFYLWYVDLKKSYSILLSNFHKTLFNISKRRQAEESITSIKSILEKCERSDVKANKDLLPQAERNMLDDWIRARDQLSVLEARVEEAAFVLGDLGRAYGASD